jgi:hypothetical protein
MSSRHQQRQRDSHSVQPKLDAANATVATDQAGLAPLKAQAATDA